MHESDFDKVKELLEKKDRYKAILEMCNEKDPVYTSLTIAEINGKPIDLKAAKSLNVCNIGVFEAFYKYVEGVLNETVDALRKLGVEVE